MTGLAGTGAVGAVTVDFGYSVTGVSGTGAVGTVSVNQAFAVTGSICYRYYAIGTRSLFGTNYYLLHNAQWCGRTLSPNWIPNTRVI